MFSPLVQGFFRAPHRYITIYKIIRTLTFFHYKNVAQDPCSMDSTPGNMLQMMQVYIEIFTRQRELLVDNNKDQDHIFLET